MLPGVNKLSWASPPHQAAFWQKDALRCCKDVAAAVGELRAANAAVACTAALFRDSLLLRVERKRLFDLPEFEQRQAAHLVRVQRVEREGWLATDGSSVVAAGMPAHMSLANYCFPGFPECLACPPLPLSSPQAATTAQLADAHSSLRACLVSLWARFAGDSEEVAAEWLAWLRRADQSLLEALTTCVRRSLHEVARAVQGEHKGVELSPVFVLGVMLDTNGR